MRLISRPRPEFENVDKVPMHRVLVVIPCTKDNPGNGYDAGTGSTQEEDLYIRTTMNLAMTGYEDCSGIAMGYYAESVAVLRDSRSDIFQACITERTH